MPKEEEEVKPTSLSEEIRMMFVILDQMVMELFEEISILHNVNAIISKHNWSIQQWDRVYLDLEECKSMKMNEKVCFFSQTSDRYKLSRWTK